jgi:hypothetical protein
VHVVSQQAGRQQSIVEKKKTKKIIGEILAHEVYFSCSQ